MTDRERLIEILENAGHLRQYPGSMASILIENDVTIREHGIWHKYLDHFTKRQVGWICTNCSAVSYDISNGDTQFCPHCGALMDWKDEDETDNL